MGCGSSKRKEGQPPAADDGPRPPAGADNADSDGGSSGSGRAPRSRRASDAANDDGGAESDGSVVSSGSGRAAPVGSQRGSDDSQGSMSSGSGRAAPVGSDSDPSRRGSKRGSDDSQYSDSSGSGRGGPAGPPVSDPVKRLPFDGGYDGCKGWEANWDKPPPGPTGGPAPAAATLKIILIRHGEHDKVTPGSAADQTAPLNAHGQNQARAAGRRLRELTAAGRLSIDQVLVSTMTRARQTADAILQELGAANLVPVVDAQLCEGFPYPYAPPGRTPWHHAMQGQRDEMLEDHNRIMRAFDTYFKRPTNGQSKTVLIVCHANISKFLICKALQFPPEGYQRLQANNCGMTTLLIDQSGGVRLECLNDTCHLPDRPGPASAAASPMQA